MMIFTQILFNLIFLEYIEDNSWIFINFIKKKTPINHPIDKREKIVARAPNKRTKPHDCTRIAFMSLACTKSALQYSISFRFQYTNGLTCVKCDR